MKTSAVLSLALLGLATASPVALPQDIDFDSYDSIPVAVDKSAPVNPVVAPAAVSYDPSAAITSAVSAATAAVDADLNKREIHLVEKRGSCNASPAGNAPAVSPDTDIAFLTNPDFATAANGATPPPGYFLAVGYQNLAASASSPSYLTYISDPLTSYDPAQCATACNAMTGCVSFNIFFERDPSIYVDSVNCPTASSVTRIKCSFFGAPITVADATNAGQYTGNFHVVIAGSNTYTTAPQPLPGFTGPVSVNNASIISPTAANTYMGVQSFVMTQPFDPSVCAAACTEKSAYNTRHAVAGVAPRLCMFFDAYILYKNGANGVFTCTYYTQAYDKSYATNFGQYNSAGDHFTIGHSYLYSVSS
ncbi:uncharacterized protein LY89DRAFT_682731 [Mollisia scopiformis]|uniref:Uncharacterized protein n=1 Tax=Mollisia scopiformis TaxID=149040 RepID=A0A194XI44_MOLSC|nr:uncharacterized protein LY89DRAFT_682731 [Mollisia scopiformis]KUJ19895.1 hypothetical protein LY89DRAFT_682731 [Mollisia scopiformis]